MATCSLLNLSMQMVFLVSITSTWRVGEIGTLMADPRFMVFCKDKLSLHPRPIFLTKVSFEFPLDQSIHLLYFFSWNYNSQQEASFHILDVRRALAFYLDRTKALWRSPSLFVSTADWSKGSTISTQKLSTWISGWLLYITKWIAFNLLPGCWHALQGPNKHLWNYLKMIQYLRSAEPLSGL